MSKVSILLITYNQEKYVQQAVESILMQKIDFDYEVILADDCSTDKTQEILNNYVKKYPHIFKPHYSKRNLGITKNYQRAFKLCTSEYIAILEGDDYWVDNLKLSKQIQFLEENDDCILCFNQKLVYYQEKEEFIAAPNFISNQELPNPQLFSIEQLIKEGNFIGNFSVCVYRNSAIQKIDSRLYELNVYDWGINIYIAQFGTIAYLAEIMSVYRIHKDGVWSGKTQIRKLHEILNTINNCNSLLNYRYNKEFNLIKKHYQNQLTTMKYEKLFYSSLKVKIKNTITLATSNVLALYLKLTKRFILVKHIRKIQND